MKRISKTKTKNLIIFIVAIVFSLLLGELIFRLYGAYTGTDFTLYSKELTNPDRLPIGLFAFPDKEIVQTLKPNFQALATTSDFSVIYKINEKGLRDKSYEYEKNNKVRVLALGDSQTFGEGISYGDRFTDIA